MFRNLLLILLCIIYMTGCGYSQKSFKVLVVDETGTPIPRAEVLLTSGKSAGLIKQLVVQGVDFSGKGGSLPGKKILEKTYVADENGEVKFSKITGKNVNINVVADGYHASMDSDGDRSNILIPLRKINKIENILIGEERKVLALDQVYEYDFLIKDFLPPHGRGKKSDISFKYSDAPEIIISGVNNGFSIMNIRNTAYPISAFGCPTLNAIPSFVNDYDKAIEIGSINRNEKRAIDEGRFSEKKSDEYHEVMKKIWFWTDISFDYRPNSFAERIFFRIRNGHYLGIIKNIVFYKQKDEKIKISFDYALNLDGSESLEMNPCMRIY